MNRACVKSLVATGIASGLILSTTGIALPARTPPLQDPRTALKPVVLYNQTSVLAQGLSPKAAIQRAAKLLKFPLTTAHYLPKGYTMVVERVFPIAESGYYPGDTQTFYLLSAVKQTKKGVRVTSPPSFEIDHQLGRPYTYANGDAYFTISSAKAGRRQVTIAEQKYTDARTHKKVDLLYIYWYDQRTRLATEVTAELASSKLSKSNLLKVAASVS